MGKAILREMQCSKFYISEKQQTSKGANFWFNFLAAKMLAVATFWY
jgi:hypothetical protein